MLMLLDSLVGGARSRLAVSTSMEFLGVTSTLMADPISTDVACVFLCVGVQKLGMAKAAGVALLGTGNAGLWGGPRAGEECTMAIGLDCAAADIWISSDDLLPPMAWGPAASVTSISIACVRRRGFGAVDLSSLGG
jgi:hypothetical protein